MSWERSEMSGEWTGHFLMKIHALGLKESDFEKLMANSLADPVVEYNYFMYKVCGIAGLQTNLPFGTTFPLGTKYADAIDIAVYPTVVKLAVDMYDKLWADRVTGCLVEFGVAAGSWLAMQLDNMERCGMIRETWGFDSFEGLPSPDDHRDAPGWYSGQFANELADVAATLDLGSRPHLHLVPGWFSDSLRTPQAQAIKSIAYAKIDGDLYESAVDCLAFLKGRLSNGAVLMFDEWTHVLHQGETRAFFEWVPRVPEYRFELVGFINYRIFFRVWHVSVPDLKCEMA
ncbi:TylF/MycF/NovP-related O-methyltransferase [Lichenihabitans psoromatis]|uniref:TylF/MycF/NovP-related O-methyltransferase n=1 Tax=Lichenihabitans psoromatis TaxID=2528642 RepID=UPI0010360038|nr:TylF/MycF/NovP-related O-methyltransferase [Lichenihabitans psoromatis]